MQPSQEMSPSRHWRFRVGGGATSVDCVGRAFGGFWGVATVVSMELEIALVRKGVVGFMV